MPKKFKIQIVLSIFSIASLVLFYSPHSFSSGSFVPGGGQKNSESYNLGKALTAGKVSGVTSCKGCHQKYSRGKLRNISSTVGDLIINCDKHTPCYKDELDGKQVEAVNVYFSKRYNLR